MTVRDKARTGEVAELGTMEEDTQDLDIESDGDEEYVVKETKKKEDDYVTLKVPKKMVLKETAVNSKRTKLSFHHQTMQVANLINVILKISFCQNFQFLDWGKLQLKRLQFQLETSFLSI